MYAMTDKKYYGRNSAIAEVSSRKKHISPYEVLLLSGHDKIFANPRKQVSAFVAKKTETLGGG